MISDDEEISSKKDEYAIICSMNDEDETGSTMNDEDDGICAISDDEDGGITLDEKLCGKSFGEVSASLGESTSSGVSAVISGATSFALVAVETASPQAERNDKKRRQPLLMNR